MNKNKHSIIFVLATFFFLTTSFTEKPHLIVGDWKAMDNAKFTLPGRENLVLQKWYFSSDEFTSIVSFTILEEEYEYNLPYKIYENKEGFSKPIILFKNICNEKFLLVFSIEELSKSSLILKFEKKISSKDIDINPINFQLYRIAGPPENMD